MRKDCYDELNKKYQELLQVKIKEIEKTIYKDVQQQNQKVLDSYVKQIEELEKKRENEFNEMSKVMMSGIQKDGESNFSMIKTTHHGIKCNQCKKEPIVGYRYKCHVCDDYNLCEICEEKNSITQEHNHNFIKIRKSEKKEEIKIKENEPQPQKVIDINKIEEKKEYNYESEEKNLNIDAKGFDDKEVTFIVILKNIGNLQWPNGKTQLLNDKNSDIKSNNYVLKNLKKGEHQEVNIKLNLDKMRAGNKKCIFHFNVNGKNYGEP